MRFNCYDLDAVQQDPAVLYKLGGGILPEIAEAFSFELPKTPTSVTLRELTAKVAPNKKLRDNIAYAKEVLGEDAFGYCNAWLKRSGAMEPVRGGSFIDPTVAAPKEFNTLVWSGGTANWMLRRRALTEQIKPRNIGQVILPMGDRRMAEGEHTQVETYLTEVGQLPTEAEFANRFIVPVLVNAGFGIIRLIPVESGSSDVILAQLFDEHAEILDPEHTTLVIGNAPNAVQATGQLRAAGRKIDVAYDYHGRQLFFQSDGFPIALHNEPANEAQNPVSGLGQVLRNFKVLLDNIESPKAA
jgi:hypothetical protein